MTLRTILGGLITASFLIGCNGADTASEPASASPYFAETDRIVDLDGQSIRYRETGPADAPALILLHGFTDSLHTWDALTDRLDEDFRILRPDLPGHALSGPNPDGDYSNEALVEFVAALMDATKTDRATLVGNSLGGLAAWRLAVAQPDRVTGLVLLAPGGVPYAQIGEEPAEVPMMLKLFLRSAPDVGIRQMLQTLHADPDRVTDDLVTRYGDLMRVPGNGDAMVERAAQFAFPRPDAKLTEIQAPTVVIWGAQDAVLSPDQADVFAKSIPDVSVRILEGVGHLPQLEATDFVAQAIRDIATIESDAP